MTPPRRDETTLPTKITMSDFSKPPGPDAQPEVCCKTTPHHPHLPPTDLPLYPGVLIRPTRDRNVTWVRAYRAASTGPHPPYEGSQRLLHGLLYLRGGVLIRPTRDRNYRVTLGGSGTVMCPHPPYEGSQRPHSQQFLAIPQESSSALRGIATRGDRAGAADHPGPHPPYEGSQRCLTFFVFGIEIGPHPPYEGSQLQQRGHVRLEIDVLIRPARDLRLVYGAVFGRRSGGPQPYHEGSRCEGGQGLARGRWAGSHSSWEGRGATSRVVAASSAGSSSFLQGAATAGCLSRRSMT